MPRTDIPWAGRLIQIDGLIVSKFNSKNVVNDVIFPAFSSPELLLFGVNSVCRLSQSKEELLPEAAVSFDTNATMPSCYANEMFHVSPTYDHRPV